MSQEVQVFDLDSTLITGDSSRSWCQYLVEHGLVTDPKLFLAKEQEFDDQYQAGILKVEDYVGFIVSSMNHTPYSQLCQILDTYVETVVKPMMCREGLEIIERSQRNQVPCLVISASAAYLVTLVAEKSKSGDMISVIS